jgi:biopolymer transport protein ExbD
MLVLLVVFMITAPLLSTGLRVELPIGDPASGGAVESPSNMELNMVVRNEASKALAVRSMVATSRVTTRLGA